MPDAGTQRRQRADFTADLAAVLSGGGDPLQRGVVFDLRLPRALAAICTGAMLATAGTLMQVLLRNPLADPYVLGVSGGAAVAVLLGMLAGVGAAVLNLAAFAGALFAVLLVFGLAQGRGGWTPYPIAAYRSRRRSGLGGVDQHDPGACAQRPSSGHAVLAHGRSQQRNRAGDSHGWCSAITLLIGWGLARPLDLLARGELQAESLGVHVSRRADDRLCIGVPVLTAVSVTIAGSVGFVGLVVPHMVRLVLGAGHRRLLPAAALTRRRAAVVGRHPGTQSDCARSNCRSAC